MGDTVFTKFSLAHGPLFMGDTVFIFLCEQYNVLLLRTPKKLRLALCIYLPNPSTMNRRTILKWSTADFNSEFIFSYSRGNTAIYHLMGRDEFMPSPKAFVITVCVGYNTLNVSPVGLSWVWWIE